MHCQEQERWDSVGQLWCFDYLEGGRKKGKKASWELKQRTKEVIIGCNDEKAMDYGRRDCRGSIRNSISDFWVEPKGSRRQSPTQATPWSSLGSVAAK